jgi:conjugative transposon TraM protein
MKESENKKPAIRVTDGSSTETSEVAQENVQNKSEKLKKPIIFLLMGVVFLGCMYLIFKPTKDKKKVENVGLNDAVPQATDAGLQADKQKAYEQEMLEQKNREKQNALTSLSDYWNEDTAKGTKEDVSEAQDKAHSSTPKNTNPALSSYRNAQSTLSSFYQNDNAETVDLRKQLAEVKEQLAEKNTEPNNNMETQLALMEKSYQMAAKYLPMNVAPAEQSKAQGTPASGSPTQKETFVAFTPAHKNAVSALYREPTDSAFIAGWSGTRNRGFYTAGRTEQEVQPKNSIRAVVQETQVVTGESGIRLRLLEPAKTPKLTIPQGTVLTANAKFQQGRLQMKVTSIELDGNIIPVDITIYDLDGQQGLFVPYSPEMNALTEMASNMAQISGTSLMLTQSAGQQIAADLSRGVVQGVSGYFAKKIRTPKVTLKAGHQVFLISKN